MKEETRRFVKCAYCGKEKEILRYQWKRSKTQLFFCDNKCFAHYQYGDVFKKDLKKCKVCGKELHGYNEICKSQFFTQGKCNLERLGFDVSAIGTERVFEEYKRLKDKIEKLYYNEEMSCADILNNYNISSDRIIDRLFKFLHIKRRSKSEANVIAFKKEKLKVGNPIKYPFKRGYHTSWEGKELYYRSSYELDYMNTLDEAKISYQGEGFQRFEYYDTQLKKKRIAIPDFYLPETNTIVEIKSNYTYNAQNMVDKAKSYKEAGYNFKLILDHKEIEGV